MSKARSVPIRLTDDLVAKIEAHPEYRPPAPGVAGGVAQWIREAIYERLGESAPVDYHRARTERRGPKHTSRETNTPQ